MKPVPRLYNPPTNLEYTHVRRVSRINVPEEIGEYFGDLPFERLFTAYDVRGDGNCGYYVVQLFFEWRFSLAGTTGEQPPIVDVATFRQQFRQHLQDVGRPYYQLYLPNGLDFQTVLNRVYDPRKIEVNDYYNHPPKQSALPVDDWATDDAIFMMARWADVDNVVVFSKQTVTIADMSGEELPNGTSPHSLYLDNVKGNKQYLEMICSLNRNNTLFVYFTGCHYIWLKVNESLMPQGIATSILLMVSPVKDKEKKRKDEDDCNPSPAKSSKKSTSVKSPKESPRQTCAACNTRNRECILCLEKEPQVAFIPCGHALVCQDCIKLNGDKLKRCPTCRVSIERSLRIYF
jgi:hypothetical protein